MKGMCFVAYTMYATHPLHFEQHFPSVLKNIFIP